MKLDLSKEVSNAYDKLVNANNKLVEVLEKAVDEDDKVPTKVGKPFGYEDFRRYFEATSTRVRCAAKDLSDIKQQHDLKLKEISNPLELIEKRSISEVLICSVESFFFRLSSTLDSLAWIFQTIWHTPLDDRDVTFSNVVEQLKGDAFFAQLKKYDAQPGWIWEAKQYRNFITHYRFLDTRMEVRWEAKTLTLTGTLYKIPDNPKHSPLEYEQKREMKGYCEAILMKLLDLMTESFDFVSGVM